MNFSYLKNTPLEKAIEQYTTALEISLKAVEIDVYNSLGKVTSEAVFAKNNAPHYNASAMDGIVLEASLTYGATETTPVILTENVDFFRVDTGDAIPEGLNAVVMIEEVIEKGEGRIMLLSAASPWQHVRKIGEDLCSGEMIVPSNTKVTPSMVGAFLCAGVSNVKVWKTPIVGIIPTGDEIVHPCENPKSGEIIEFNSSIFSSMLKEWGISSVVYPIVKDDLGKLQQALMEASEDCDLVLINAGSSAGREDYTKTAINTCGKVFVHGIAIKPGKPAILGEINQKPVIGIPGYPVSGIIVMEEIVKKVISRLYHILPKETVEVNAVLSRTLMSSLKYQEFVRVKLGKVENKYIATPLSRGAGVISSFVKADGILIVPTDTEGLEVGSSVKIKLLRGLADIDKTLVINGSHDMLIDIAGDLLMKMPDRIFISSSHVGSMGGIMAIKRKEAHIAGIHILDPKDGTYNVNAMNQYFKADEMVLLRGVGRLQGLMYDKSIPFQFEQLKDCSLKGVKFINRQKGSGTRILLDYLLNQNEIDPNHIEGYTNEEYTHVAVATQIASGNANVGLGVLAAAQAANLAFTPICEERYDFILYKESLNLPLVQSFIEVLKSLDFKQRLCQLGGYSIEGCGTLYSANGENFN